MLIISGEHLAPMLPGCRYTVVANSAMTGNEALLFCHAITFLASPKTELASIVYQPYLPETGNYNVYGWWPNGPDFATNTPMMIHHADGKQQLTVNQRAKGGQWMLL